MPLKELYNLLPDWHSGREKEKSIYGQSRWHVKVQEMSEVLWAVKLEASLSKRHPWNEVSWGDLVQMNRVWGKTAKVKVLIWTYEAALNKIGPPWLLCIESDSQAALLFKRSQLKEITRTYPCIFAIQNMCSTHWANGPSQSWSEAMQKSRIIPEWAIVSWNTIWTWRQRSQMERSQKTMENLYILKRVLHWETNIIRLQQK